MLKTNIFRLILLPKIFMQLINLSIDKSKLNPYLSNTLLLKIEETLKKWEKTILYLNKRWEFSCLVCKDCQSLEKCKYCDTLLNVHRKPAKLLCHICSYEKEIPIKCSNCFGSNLEKVWVWTEQIEIALKKYFPKAKIFRFDTDSMKTKSSKTEAINEVEKADIIIWTKMITTWFNFSKVGLIWVILAEQELQIPKYDVEENLYQNIKQLLWRWGRVWQETDFVIQTFVPDNALIQNIAFWNYKEFFNFTLNERKTFHYPPFCELLYLEYKDLNKEKALEFIMQIKNKLDLENSSKSVEIIFNTNCIKKFNEFHYKIILKWQNLRDFLSCIKPEIMRNRWLVLIPS